MQRTRADSVETVLNLDGDDAGPLASVFKLYVLAAVIHQIEAGTLAWDDTVTVSEATRSLPTGELQNEPAGTAVSVRDAAQKMIEISDNTATDLLIDRVGRDSIERAVALLGHHDPSLLRPFPTTREVFALAWGGHEGVAEEWERGDEQQRRGVLGRLAELPFTVTAQSVTPEAIWDDGLDWFASPRDVTSALDALDGMATRHPEVRDILSANPGGGLRFDLEAWPHIGFKGGSSPGVLAGSWLADNVDGSRLTVVVMAASHDPLELAQRQHEFFGLVEDIFRLVG